MIVRRLMSFTFPKNFIHLARVVAGTISRKWPIKARLHAVFTLGLEKIRSAHPHHQNCSVLQKNVISPRRLS